MRKKVNNLIRRVVSNQEIDYSPYEKERNLKVVTELVPQIDRPWQLTGIKTVGESKDPVFYETVYSYIKNKKTGKIQRVPTGRRLINPKKRLERQARKNWNGLPRPEREKAYDTLLTAVAHGVSFGAET